MKLMVILRYCMFVIYIKIFIFIFKYLEKSIIYLLLICLSLLIYLIYFNIGVLVYKV